ncbi:MAG: 4-hydroxy-tetrahydrodipicolinate synthase [Mariprofundaceae bacterium]
MDEEALLSHLDRQVEAGVDAVVPAGTTGESATLSHDEHKKLVRTVVKHVRGRVPVIAGAGSNSTAETIELTRAARDAGADAALLISPYYNKPDQEGIYQHYRSVAEAVHIPVILYNVPGRTASNMLPETVGRLAEVANIIGIKDATADMAQLARTMNAGNGRIEFYSGDDATVMPFMAMGGAGVISVASNIVPQAMIRLVQAMRRNDIALAGQQQLDLQELNDALFIQSNPIPVKAACAMMGWMGWDIRLPLTILPEAKRIRLHATLKAFGLEPKSAHP